MLNGDDKISNSVYSITFTERNWISLGKLDTHTEIIIVAVI